VGEASELLLAGIDIEHVHTRYVIVAIELLADAEATVCWPLAVSVLPWKSSRGSSAC